MNHPEDAPEFARIPETCRRYGLSRSRLYLLAGQGNVRFIKVANATLVDLASVRGVLGILSCGVSPRAEGSVIATLAPIADSITSLLPSQ